MHDAFPAHAVALVTDLSLMLWESSRVDDRRWTSVEESPVAEMLVSKVVLLGFVVSVRATTAPTSGTSNMSPTSEDSSGRHWCRVPHESKLAQHDLFTYWKETKACKADVHLWPKEIDDVVAKLHLPASGETLIVFPVHHWSSMRKWQNCTL